MCLCSGELTSPNGGVKPPLPRRTENMFDFECGNSYRSRMKAIVSKNGRVAIPKSLRIRLDIRAGEILEVKEEHGGLVISKVGTPLEPFDNLFGILKLGRLTDEMMEELRGREEARWSPAPGPRMSPRNSEFIIQP